MLGERILIVEDDPETRRVLEKALRKLGLVVSTAASGEDGLKLALTERPAIILTDLRMPQVDGHTLLRRLKAEGVDSVVIVLSGAGDKRDVIDALRSGAVDYLEKPWNNAELLAALARAHELYTARRGAQPPPPDPLTSGHLAGADGPQTPSSHPTDPRPPAASRPAASSGAPLDFSGVLEELRRGEIILPSLPPVLAELQGLLARPDAALNEITALVERDPRLAAQVLRLTNTTRYARGARVAGIHAALGRLGLRQLSNMVQTINMRDAHQLSHSALRAVHERIWRFSVGRAIAMRALAELTSAPRLDPETAYVAGLLADAGASAFLRLMGVRLGPPDRPVSEEQIFATIRPTHPEFGGRLLTKWEMDPVVAALAEAHHFDAAPPANSALWCVSILASSLAGKVAQLVDVTAPSPLSDQLVDRCGAQLRIGTAVVNKLEPLIKDEIQSMFDSLA